MLSSQQKLFQISNFEQKGFTSLVRKTFVIKTNQENPYKCNYVNVKSSQCLWEDIKFVYTEERD